MKKLFCMVLALAFALAAAPASAADPDPIIGAWYLHIDVSEAPQIAAYEGYVRLFQVITFEENGNITSFEVDIKSGDFDTNGPFVSGTWQAAGDGKYSVMLIGEGLGTAYLKGSVLYVPLMGNYLAFRPAAHFDWSSDVLSEIGISLKGW